MNRKEKFTLEETPGDQFPNLESAQSRARSMLAGDLLGIMRRMIDNGLLEIKDGRIMPKESNP